MDLEIRFRVPASFHGAATLAAASRGIPLSALAATALYEHLRERGELKPSVAPTSVAPSPDSKTSLPVPSGLVWRDGVHTDADGEDWTMEELKRAYDKGQDPLRHYG